MHTVIDAFSSVRFVFLGASLTHEVLTFVCCTFDQGRRHASSPAPRTQETFFCRCLTIMYAKFRSNDRLTRDSQPPPTKQILSLFGAPSTRESCPSQIFRRKFCCSRETVSCAYLPCNSSQDCHFFFTAIPRLLAETKSRLLSGDPRAWSITGNVFGCSCPWSTRRRPGSHVPGTPGLRNGHQCSPPFVK